MPAIEPQDRPFGFSLQYTLKGHIYQICDLAWSPDGRMIASASNDGVKIWDVESGKLIRSMNGNCRSVSWSPDGRSIAVASGQGIFLMDIGSGERPRAYKAHSEMILSVAWSPDGSRIASGSTDRTVRISDAATTRHLRTFQDVSGWVYSVAWSPDSRFISSGPSYKTIRLHDSNTGETIRALRGHNGTVNKVVWSRDGKLIASGSTDQTVRLWDVRRGTSLSILEGHTSVVTGVSLSADSHFLASKSRDGTVCIRRCDSYDVVAILKESSISVWPSGLSFHPSQMILATLGGQGRDIRIWKLDSVELLNQTRRATIRYRNAKVVLVGDTGVGKSGLGMVLAGQKFRATQSTHGRHVWRLETSQYNGEDGLEETREILLWDLAGQAEYRVIHQLSLDETCVALVLFDGSSPTDPFKGVDFWNKALKQAEGSENLIKFLVASRTDVSPLMVTEGRLMDYAAKGGFQDAFRVSAATGMGMTDLLQRVKTSINWDVLPITVSETLFKQIMTFVVRQKNRGRVIRTTMDLINQFQGENARMIFTESEFRTVLGHLEFHDMVKRISYGDYILLQSEILDNYASSMARAAREQPDGLGYLDEQIAREGKFDFGSIQRCDMETENIILQSVVELFIQKELAILDENRLIFPSQLNREFPEHPEVEGSTVSYQFEGAILNAYATLVVRLFHSDAFNLHSLWKNAAIYLPFGLKDDINKCGFALREVDEGVGIVIVFFGLKVPDVTKILFIKYIHEHLKRKSLNGNVQRERIYRCTKCGNEVVDRRAVKSRIQKGLSVIPCLYCPEPTDILLSDLIEETFGKEDLFMAQVRAMDNQIDNSLDNESKDTVLRGDIMSIAGKAGQICRLLPSDDWGIDGEIEFKTDHGLASGERIYFQLKSGASYLKDRRDGTRAFYISKKRHIDYWQSQKYPVFLVIRDKDEKMYWMNISEHLKHRSDKASRTIVFSGEELTIEALRVVRKQRLRPD